MKFDYLVVSALMVLATCSAAFAGGASAPELDPGTLNALVSGLTGAFVVFRLYRGRKAK